MTVTAMQVTTLNWVHQTIQHVQKAFAAAFITVPHKCAQARNCRDADAHMACALHSLKPNVLLGLAYATLCAWKTDVIDLCSIPAGEAALPHDAALHKERPLAFTLQAVLPSTTVLCLHTTKHDFVWSLPHTSLPLCLKHVAQACRKRITRNMWPTWLQKQHCMCDHTQPQPDWPYRRRIDRS